ncbi:alpha/beta fold hydrolase [Halobacterium litoreum]|uniref:Alpha/beta fold hydrolase n=1 Tax=Halobacterium litoreum TaxID=2039234 RepID=A0ABD5NFX3_9EURY|nr:alpha/beta hydrolase [Halobacterium litoreum]UHH12895.1 alpha/beta hydrolase [Halobacterium litoreum]
MATGQVRVVEGAERVTLDGGRELSFAEYGDPDGDPVFFFHGTPGSRVSGSVTRASAADRGVRVVAPDRPGFGQSAFAGLRGFEAFADDVLSLADALGVDEFGVVGFSGGGPYALGCAAHAPERVTRCGVVSGVGPPGVATDEKRRFDRWLAGVAKRSVALARPLAWLLCRRVDAASRFTDVVGEPQDGDLADPRLGETGRVLLSDFREAVRQGPTPLAADYATLAREWDFDLGDVTAPTRVFHGSDDDAVPLAAGEHVAERVPEASLSVYDGAGHFRPLVEQSEDALSWVVSAETGDGVEVEDTAEVD